MADILEEGTYRAKAIRAQLGLTGTGKEQIGVTFALVDPPGAQITWFGFFTEKTFDRTMESLRHCGWTGTDLSEFSGGPMPEGFGKEVEIVVGHEEYEGKTVARVQWVNSGGGLAMKTTLTPEQARAFAARMKGKVVTFDQQSGQPKAAAQRQGRAGPPPPRDEDAPPPKSDDIPF